MGVYDGVTGVFLRPWEGAREEGAAGFAKGLGKGLIGFVARPVSGVVDFASSSFEAVKKVTDVNAEVKRIRPPRYIHSDKIIRPYCLADAEGAKLLWDAEKGKYSSTDTYIAHAPISKDRRYYFVVTDQRVLVIKKNEVFGNWEVEWEYTYAELKQPPLLKEKSIRIDFKKREKKLLGLAGSSGGKMIQFLDHPTAEWLCEKADDQYQKSL